MTIKIIQVAMALMAVSLPIYAQSDAAQQQEMLTVKALFEYPMAPEEMEGIGPKSDWLMENFWNAMDFKKTSVDQTALNHAFEVYATPMRWALKENVEKSVDKLIASVQKNPTLMFQFTKAAENALYGPQADMWIDDVYVKFLQALLKTKKIPDSRKEKYKKQLKKLEASKVGTPLPSFQYVARDGSKTKFRPVAVSTIIIFANPADNNTRRLKIQLDLSKELNSILDEGKANFLYLTLGEGNEAWQKEVADYPEKWSVGAFPDGAAMLDLRVSPSFYIIGADGLVKAKNISPDEAIGYFYTTDSDNQQ